MDAVRFDYQNHPPFEFLQAIALGLIPGYTSWSKMGFTPTMTTAQSDIWGKAGSYAFPTAKGKWEVVSSDALDIGTILHNATCDASGNTTTLNDESEDFSDVAIGDCVILDKSGTTPEWGYVTAQALHSLTIAGGFSSGGSCATARAYVVLDKSDKTGAQAVRMTYLDDAYAERLWSSMAKPPWTPLIQTSFV